MGMGIGTNIAGQPPPAIPYVPIPVHPTDPELARTIRVRNLISNLRSHWRPPERLPLSIWSERNIVLSSEYSARSSNLRLYGWQRGIFDSFTDPRTSEVTLMCGTQLVKTLFIQCAMAYSIAVAPGPILIVLPTDDDARAFSKERLNPMIRDCAVLDGLISQSSHDGANTLQMKQFPGGVLALVGSRVPANVAKRSTRYAFLDEPDKYPASAGDEGDVISLAKERVATYQSLAKLIYTCSPTVEGRSRIQKSYLSSDRRKPWVPCHKCGTLQILDFHRQVKFAADGTDAERAASAHYECSNLACRAPWNDQQRWAACEKTVWIAERPFAGHAGFWINHLYSPWKTLAQIVANFLRMKNDRNQLKVFINTNLAETWKEKGETPSDETLYSKREYYPFGDDAVVPMRGLFLTASVDVQDSPPRLEAEIIAWGRGRENWSIDYRVIQEQAPDGELLPVTSRALWDRLDTEVLNRLYPHESGHMLPILCMTIDTGSRPKPVYEFALRHTRLGHGPTGIRFSAARTVVPIKGTDDALKIISKVSKEDASRKRQGIRIVGIGTHCAKQEIYDALQGIQLKPPDETGTVPPMPGYYHHPNYTMAYFQGLTSEIRVVNDDDSVEYIKKEGVRNEPLDLKVYNRAAASIVGIDRFTEAHWQRMEAQLGLATVIVAVTSPGEQATAADPVPAAATQPATTPAPTPVQPAPPRPAPVAGPPRVRGTRGSFV